jgi:redox-sensing transcriptional repressor
LSRGFPVIAIVDNDPKKIGRTTSSLTVGDVKDLKNIVRDEKISIGVITTSSASSQAAADALVEAGITSILNFAPVVLSTPSSVSVRSVDLGVELQILSYFEQMRLETGSKSENVPQLNIAGAR